MQPGKKIATWYNDGTPHGRFEYEPGMKPRERFDWIGPLAGVLLVVIWLVLFFTVGPAKGADKPAIDPVVAAAWAFSAPQPMPEAMPSYRLYQDARGQWWQVPVQTPAVEVGGTAPFPQARNYTAGMVVQPAAVRSSASPVTTRTGLIRIGAGSMGLSGGIANCTVG